MQGDLLVHVLEEMQDAREVVVDHEVLDPVEQDDGSGSVGHEVRDQVAQAVQVVRIDVVLAQRRREPDDADFLVSATPDDVVRMLARDVHRLPAGVDRLLERREGLVRLLLLHQVGAAFLEVLLLPEEKVLEKLVLLEGEQERPREPPHGTTLPSGGRFLYVSYRLSHLRLIWVDASRGRHRPIEGKQAQRRPTSGFPGPPWTRSEGTEPLSRDAFSSARHGAGRRWDHRRIRPRGCVRTRGRTGEVPRHPVRGAQRSAAVGKTRRGHGGLPPSTREGPSDSAAQVEPPREPVGPERNRRDPHSRHVVHGLPEEDDPPRHLRRPRRLHRILGHPNVLRRPGRPRHALAGRSRARGLRHRRERGAGHRSRWRDLRADDRPASRDAGGGRALQANQGRRRNDDGLGGDTRFRTRDPLRLSVHGRQLLQWDRRRAADLREDPRDATTERGSHAHRRRESAGANPMSILIRDVHVEGDVTQVYIEGNRIAEIGKKREADTVIDGKGKIALPGFVNLHTHAAMTLFRGWGDDLELSTWLETKIWPAEARLTPDDVYWGTKLACLEMIKTGTTTFNDMYFHMDAAAKAVKEMGLRAFLAEGIVDLNDAERAAKQLRTADDVNRRIEALKTDRITPVLGPHAIYTVSKDSLLRIREIADKTGSLIHIHLSETKREVDDCVTH